MRILQRKATPTSNDCPLKRIQGSVESYVCYRKINPPIYWRIYRLTKSPESKGCTTNVPCTTIIFHGNQVSQCHIWANAHQNNFLLLFTVVFTVFSEFSLIILSTVIYLTCD